MILNQTSGKNKEFVFNVYDLQNKLKCNKSIPQQRKSLTSKVLDKSLVYCCFKLKDVGTGTRY